MRLSQETKRRLAVALTSEAAADEIESIILGVVDAIENQTFSGSASSEADGLMSKEDFDKLAGIDPEANKYVLPAAGAEIGGVKQGAAVSDATDEATAVTQLNLLLSALRTAGVIASGT